MKRKYKYGAAGIAFTVVFLAVIVLINVIVSVLSTKTNLYLDMSSENLYAITNDTYALLDTISEPVTISIVTDEDTVDNAIGMYVENFSMTQYLKQYAKYSDKVTYEQIDLNVNPGFATKYAINTYYCLVVRTADKYKTVSLEDMLILDKDDNGNAYAKGICAEQKIASAIKYVTTKTTNELAYTTGHSETTATGIDSIANDSGFDTGSVDLKTAEIGENVKTVAIVAPLADFTVDELDKIDRFLDKGDVLLQVYLSAQSPSLPNLEKYLNQWGIGVNHVIVSETNEFDAGEDATAIIAQSTSDSVISTIKSDVPVIMAKSTSLEQLFKQSGVYETSVLYTTTDKAYSKDVEFVDNKISIKQNTDKTGPFNLAIRSFKQVQSGSEVKNSNVVVFASRHMLSEDYLSSSSYSNAKLASAVLSLSTGKQESFYVSPIFFEDATLDVTYGQYKVFWAVFVFVIPILILAYGIFVFIRRRHR